MHNPPTPVQNPYNTKANTFPMLFHAKDNNADANSSSCPSATVHGNMQSFTKAIQCKDPPLYIDSKYDATSNSISSSSSTANQSTKVVHNGTQHKSYHSYKTMSMMNPAPAQTSTDDDHAGFPNATNVKDVVNAYPRDAASSQRQITRAQSMQRSVGLKSLSRQLQTILSRKGDFLSKHKHCSSLIERLRTGTDAPAHSGLCYNPEEDQVKSGISVRRS